MKEKQVNNNNNNSNNVKKFEQCMKSIMSVTKQQDTLKEKLFENY